MCDDAGALEEAGGANALGAIDDRSGEDGVSRTNLLTKGADCGEGEDGTDAEGLKVSDVGSGRDGRGVDGVPDAVTCEESNLGAIGQRADSDGRAGEPPGLRLG